MFRSDWESGVDHYSEGREYPPEGFIDLWPTETSGSGLLAKNNVKTGAPQPVKNFKRKGSCRFCGFKADANRDDHGGGSLDGNGAGGPVSLISNTFLQGGLLVTEKAGDQAHDLGGGCPLCFSRNWLAEQVPQRILTSGPDKTGF